jgi:hypothetical protein
LKFCSNPSLSSDESHCSTWSWDVFLYPFIRSIWFSGGPRIPLKWRGLNTAMTFGGATTRLTGPRNATIDLSIDSQSLAWAALVMFFGGQVIAACSTRNDEFSDFS